MDTLLFVTMKFVAPSTQKEAKEFLEKEWNAQFWSRTTSLTQEEYFADEDNWDRAMKHGYDVVNTARGFPPKYKEAETEEEEEDDDDDDDEEEEEGEGEEVEELETSTDTGSNVAAKPSTSGKKTEDVAQVGPVVRCSCQWPAHEIQACTFVLERLRTSLRSSRSSLVFTSCFVPVDMIGNSTTWPDTAMIASSNANCARTDEQGVCCSACWFSGNHR